MGVFRRLRISISTATAELLYKTIILLIFSTECTTGMVEGDLK